MMFGPMRQFGTSILASAGIAGIVLGFAAQKTLGNFLAGVQIALSQPMLIDDVVVVEGEFGRIEEITLTFVVVRTWDLRRLVLPITYFVEKPFQNWSRRSTEVLGTIYLYLDYQVPLGQLRAELKRLAELNPNWDKKVCGLQVTDTKENTIEVRALVSGSDAGEMLRFALPAAGGIDRVFAQQLSREPATRASDDRARAGKSWAKRNDEPCRSGKSTRARFDCTWSEEKRRAEQWRQRARLNSNSERTDSVSLAKQKFASHNEAATGKFCAHVVPQNVDHCRSGLPRKARSDFPRHVNEFARRRDGGGLRFER